MSPSRIARIALILTLTLHSLSLAQPTKYTIREVPIFPGSDGYRWGAVNDNSVVVGQEATNGQASQWKDGIVTRLPRFSAGWSYAFDINNGGVVVGHDNSRPVCWINGNEVFLGGSGPDIFGVRGEAECINSNGDIGGWYTGSIGGPTVPVIYSASTGNYRILNFGSEPDNYESFSINDNGDLVGQVAMSGQGGIQRAFVYHNDTLMLLNMSGAEYTESFARGINNLGQIVGYEGIYGGGNFNAVLWEIGNPNPTILGASAIAYAINDSGAAVGYRIPNGNPVIFRDGQAVDLNTLISENLNVRLSHAIDINNKGEILCNASVSGYPAFCLLTPAPTITVRDAKNDSIPNVEFNLINVTNDPPFFTEDTLGSFTTDSRGCLGLTQVAVDTFSVDLSTGTKQLVVGDSLKITKHVQSVPAIRHPAIVGTMYSVHLDNAHFAEDGQMYFDTLKGGGLEVVLNHTEYRYNLLVSVEWDAVEAYQVGLQEDFRQMSNYLYDVTDGQVRLDTVAIVDDGELWEQSDVRVRASNIHNPNSSANAITQVDASPIKMPRKWYGDPDDCRWYSYEDHPLDAAESDDYRAKAHEFGHFALGFFDEYAFMDGGGHSLEATARCEPRPAGNYGFMDYEYDNATGGVSSSEMSSQYEYASDLCRNTRQWVLNGNLSCWDYWESWAEETINGLYVPIRKPDQGDTLEHLTPEGLDYIPGPNDNLAVPDYDIGTRIYFANPIMSPDPANRSLNVYVDGVPVGGVDVTLKKNLTGGGKRVIEQGKTRDDGLIWVLGGSDADNIETYGHNYIINQRLATSVAGVSRQWLTGSLDVGTMAGDSGSITLHPIEGEYPMVLTADIAIAPQRWRLDFTQPFSQLPTLGFLSGSGQPMSPTVIQLTDNYNARPDDTIASEGQARLDAVDGVGNPFFVPFSYVGYDIADSTELTKLLGPDAAAILSLSSENSSITKALIVASSYPPILTGLEVDAVQAGDAYSTSVSPGVTLTGANSLTILYSDEDLKAGDSLIGDESLLKMYRWHEGLNTWDYIGGLVDTARNEVTAEISQLGTLALFTTKSPVGVEDEPESALPYRFELSQNYPNPFNPVTTIEYSVPSRADVTIEIFNVLGQRVRTLVNETKSAGSYRIEWSGTDESGRSVSTGVYLYRFSAGGVVQTKKMLLLQ